MCAAQKGFALPNKGIENAIFDTAALRGFVGVDSGGGAALETTTLLKLRHPLKARNLIPQTVEMIDARPAPQGLVLRQGTIVDATLIAAPTVTEITNNWKRLKQEVRQG